MAFLLKFTRFAHKQARRAHIAALCKAANAARHSADSVRLTAQRLSSLAASATQQAQHLERHTTAIEGAVHEEMRYLGAA